VSACEAMADLRWRLLSAAATAGLLLAAVACVTQTQSTRLAESALLEGSRSAQLRRLHGLVSEVSSVKHALLALEDKAARHTQQLAAAAEARLPGNLPAPVHTDSFDYAASVGQQQLMHGEWSQRDERDNRLHMIPARSHMRAIDRQVVLAECHYPECVTRSGMPPGSVLYPGPPTLSPTPSRSAISVLCDVVCLFLLYAALSCCCHAARLPIYACGVLAAHGGSQSKALYTSQRCMAE